MTSITPTGLCRNFFLVMDKVKSGKTLNELESHCAHNCNGRYNSSINNCHPQIMELQDMKLQEKRDLDARFPGSYLI